MERILKCRGHDAYVVLGLRADCKDDDIRRYYKKQAVLVHPDKVSFPILIFCIMEMCQVLPQIHLLNLTS